MSERCQICNKEYDYVYEISDKLWKRITNIRNGSGLRCIDCLTKEARAKNIELFWYGNLLEYID